MKIDENDPSLQNFPEKLLDYVVTFYEEYPAGKLIETELEDSMFIYDGEYKRVNDWEEENSDEAPLHYILRETIEEIVSEDIGTTTIENKGFITRSPEDFIIKRHNIIFNTRISYIYAEGMDIWSWVPTFFDIFEVLEKDKSNYDHYKIMREVCLEVVNGNYEVDVKNILNKHRITDDPNFHLIAKHAHGKRELHPIVFHLLLKQIMISEEICYPGSNLLGAKLPLKAFYYYKSEELSLTDFLNGLKYHSNWDLAAKRLGVRPWDPIKLA
ncbi:hypothetical protein BK726_06355 [Bacillus thuringiensis serovar londrina]|uniref:hypothetical protein n=1 Tax=Bacillus thuringiensis TaxID=1428 RepID=UPI000B437B18|nr:hypothetical protein [Bacillus thuringiensis]OTX92574.1 hypothetical protein BK726_06355 [Bacillus thuringiensis serovar londrina]